MYSKREDFVRFTHHKNISWSTCDEFEMKRNCPHPTTRKIIWSRGDKFQMKKKIAPTPP